MKITLVGLLFALSLPAFGMEWLVEMHTAIKTTNYQGEYLHRRGNETSVYAITHRHKNGQTESLLKQLDGNMIEILRQNNRVVCYYPNGSENLIGQAVPAAPYSQLGTMALERIRASYQVTEMGTANIAGRLAKQVDLVADEWRYRHRLWLDQASGILLQSEIIDAEGQVLEQFRYTRLELDVTITDADLVPSLAKAQVRQQTQYQQPPPTPDDRFFTSQPGWLPPYFELTMTERSNTNEHWLEKRVYSDGLATFSIFVETANTDMPDASSQASMGATQAIMTQQGNRTLTVMGEIPQKTVQRLLDSLQ